MKHIIYLFILLFAAFTISCDDSFLEENKKQIEGYTLDSPLFVQPVSEFTEVSITLPDLKNKDFKVIQYPQIIHFESFNGHVDDAGLLKLKLKVEEFSMQINPGFQDLGTIVLDVAGYGHLAIPVGYLHIGKPFLQMEPSYITSSSSYSYLDFGPSNKSIFKIIAGYSGLLFYQIIDYPAWITFSPENQSHVNELVMLEPNQSMNYDIRVKRDGLAPGYYEGDIVFISNDIHKEKHSLKVSMLVRDKTTSLSTLPIEGKVVGSTFDKQRNLLYMASHQPNKIQIYDIQNNIRKEVLLSKDVTSVSLSEDGQTLFAGQKGLLSVYRSEDLSLLHEINTTFSINDAVDAMNGFYYFSNKEDYVGNSFNNLYQFNVLSGEVKKLSTPENDMLGGYILKLKNRDNLLATRSDYTPTGLALIDISTQTPVSLKYWHQDIGRKLWQVNDGSLILSSEGKIFKTPYNSPDNNLVILENLKPWGGEEGNFDSQAFRWFDESSQTQSIWGIYYGHRALKDYGYDYPQVLEWNKENYQIKRNIEYSHYRTTIDGQTDDYPTLPHYIFSNSTGNKIDCAYQECFERGYARSQRLAPRNY